MASSLEAADFAVLQHRNQPEYGEAARLDIPTVNLAWLLAVAMHRGAPLPGTDERRFRPFPRASLTSSTQALRASVSGFRGSPMKTLMYLMLNCIGAQVRVAWVVCHQ